MFAHSRPALVALILLLTGCATDPAHRCASAELKERATIEKLIAETRERIDHGYVMVDESPNFGVNLCLGSHRSNVGVSFCGDPTDRRRPQAIDTAAETRKLEALLARRAALDARIEALTAACPAPAR